MSSIQEQLFTDLTSTQSEAIAGGVIINAGSTADASYGVAAVSFGRTGRDSFEGQLYVKDKAKDGQPVYARLHGFTEDGKTLFGSMKFFDFRGAVGPGTSIPIKASFHTNAVVKLVRIAIYRRNRSGYVAGKWASF
ncbi:MAG: hypothetical protein Kow00121_52290 [Elainellaceae cyanobacterium]